VATELSFIELLQPHADGDALRRLVRYAELLERWSRRHSLVRFATRTELVERHIVDALAGVHELREPSGRLLDVGSGAGLPGVPLLAARPSWQGVLLEPRQKRWAFLRLVVRDLDLDAAVYRARYQELDPSLTGFDAVTARALGGYADLVSWAGSRLGPAGRVLIWGTEEAAEGLKKSPGWRVLSSPLPGLDRGRLIRLQPCST
jgi:16S rRNA (guanine527-N7)-methyltransferase